MKIMKGGRGTVGAELQKPAAKSLKVATVGAVGPFSKTTRHQPFPDSNSVLTNNPKKSFRLAPTSPTRSYFQWVSRAFTHLAPYRPYYRGNYA